MLPGSLKSFGRRSIRSEPTPGASTSQTAPSVQPTGLFLGFAAVVQSLRSRTGDDPIHCRLQGAAIRSPKRGAMRRDASPEALRFCVLVLWALGSPRKRGPRQNYSLMAHRGPHLISLVVPTSLRLRTIINHIAHRFIEKPSSYYDPVRLLGFFRDFLMRPFARPRPPQTLNPATSS